MKRSFTILAMLISLSSISAFSEGSKEIYIGGYNTYLYLCSDFTGQCNNGNGDRSQFAIYGCNETDRLYFVTNSVNEAVYLGFKASNFGWGNQVVFRIKDLAGSVVYTQRPVPTSGTGYISSLNEARVGPYQLFGTGGYTAFSFHPPSPSQTYYIEFKRVSNSTGMDSPGEFDLDLFDITVADTVAHTAKTGRVYSKAWQFTEGNNCSATTYIYSTDSIITSCQFNDMSGGTWIQFCNQNGCGTSGNFIADRQSVSGQVLLPQYKIFLNPPDATLFPAATTLGQITAPAPWGERFCSNGHIIFHVTVNKPGNAEVVLSFGSPYVQRTLSQSVVAGENLFEWDGLDGSTPTAHMVPNNTPVTFTISYINGLTNLPFYDVETNQNGFNISLVSPAGATPQVFWDDTGIGGSSNLTGCSSPPGCHSWGNNFGNLMTVNTWWYNVSTTTSPALITQFRGPQTLVFNQLPPQSYCAGSNGVIFSVVSDPNTQAYHWSYTGTGVTITQTDSSYNHITVNFAHNATSGNIQVYGTNNNCPVTSTVSTLPVTIKPIPSVQTPYTKSVCSGTTVNMILTSTPSGSFFSWTSPAPTCSANIATCPAGMNNAVLINDALTLTNLNPGTVTYHVTPTLNLCSGTAQDIVISVNPLPDISNTLLTYSVCNAGTINIPLTSGVPATTFSWTAIASSGTVSGYTSANGPAINNQLFNSGSKTETVTYTVTPSVNGCTGSTKTFTVTVNPVALLTNTPPSKELCNHLPTNITLVSNVTGAQFTWTCSPSSSNITGYFDNSTPSVTINQTLDNTGYNTETVMYQLSPVFNGCPGTTAYYTVTVYPTADLSNFPLSKPVCDSTNTNITLTSNVAGTQFTWTCSPSSANVTGWTNNAVPTITLDQTLNNTGYNIETVTYNILPVANLCNGEPANFVVTVNPTANLSNIPPSKTQCDNQPTNINLTSDVAGTQFTWTCTPSSANVTGWSDNALPTTTLDQTLDNIGSDIETVTYYITASANNCQGLTTEYTVTVNPTATVTNDPLSQEQCDGLNTNVVLTSDVAGTQYTWTCTPSSANITGWSDQTTLTGSILQTLDNTGYNTETVNYHLTPSANNCTGTPANYLITVRPTPDLSNTPPSKEQCDSVSTNITLTSHVAGTQFTWTCTASSGNITGWADNALPTITLNQTLDNISYNIETVTYHLTPASKGCDGPDTNYVVTINPTPDLSNTPPSSQICDSATLNLTLTSHVANTFFTWTCTPSSANITGWSNNAVPTIALNQTLNNLGLNVENVVYYMTPAAYGCNGPIAEYAVTVVPSPDVSFTPSAQTICSGETSNITVSSTIPSATFTWTVVSSSPNLSGQSAGSGPLIAQTITNSGNTIEHLTYTVTPEAWSCPPGPSRKVVLTVNPRPIVNNSTTTFQICSAGSTHIIPTSSVPGSTFAWTASGSSADVTGFSDGAGPSIVQSLTNTGYNIEAVTYQVTATANSCPGNATPFVVTVFPVADVIFTPNGQAFCSGQTTGINLSSHVAGTSYTWTVTGSGASLSGYSTGSGDLIQQTLINSGPYPQTATYLVAPTAYTCPGTNNSVIVNVNPLPVVTYNLCADPVVTLNAQPIILKGGLPLGGAYSGAGVSAGIFTPSSAGTGAHIIAYTYNNIWGCNSFSVDTITVVNPAAFSCGNILTDIRDGQQYPTVKLGAQCWFAKNLNYGIRILSSQAQRDNCVFEKYCSDDNAANCLVTGGMYQWDELMQYTSASKAQGFCPPGWHVPAESDWAALFNFYVSNGFAGSPLKYSGYSGFNAFLSGARFNNVGFYFGNFAVMFWSSGAHGARKAWAHGMNEYNPSVSYYPSLRDHAFFIRCIKD